MTSTLDKGIIRLKRTSQYVNRGRKFKVYLNDQYITDIADGEKISLPVSAGNHQLHLTKDWIKSENYNIELTNEENINLLCGSPLKGVKLWISISVIVASFVPKWYFLSKKVDSIPILRKFSLSTNGGLSKMD